MKKKKKSTCGVNFGKALLCALTLAISQEGSGVNSRRRKGGNYIYPMMHRFTLYYQASERT